MDEGDVEHVIAHPLSMIGSDGSSLRPDGPLGRGKPHPRSYGCFPRVLAHYVRERRLLTLEQAVRKMTAVPAARLRLERKGLVRWGMDADLVVFDPRTVQDAATFAEPHRYAEGITHVLVGGAVSVQDGAHTGARNGRVLRRARRGEGVGKGRSEVSTPQHPLPPLTPLPAVALIGDWIRIGYAPVVAELLAGEARILSQEPNGGNGSRVLEHLDGWAIADRPAVVHFNCGLHDLKRSRAGDAYQVPLDRYEANLRRIVARLRGETDARLVFASTTPILDERHARRGGAPPSTSTASRRTYGATTRSPWP